MPQSLPKRGPAAAPAAALLWGLAFFLAGGAVLSLLMEFAQPGLRDPEFGCKRARLWAQLARHPGRPLVLVLGTSRTALGLRPEVLKPPRTVGGEPALVFNFGLTGAGPVYELLCLRRLLADGVRPRWVFLEVLPALLNQDESRAGAGWVDVTRLGWADLRVLGPFCRRPGLLYGRWLHSRLAPCITNRVGVLNHFAPRWLPPEVRLAGWQATTATGWLPSPWQTVDAGRYRRGVALAHQEYAPHLNDFQVGAVQDRALRKMIGLCRRRGVGVAVVLMPEGGEFRSWYPSAARRRLDLYLDRLRRELHVPVVDGRTWMADAHFSDGHHLLPPGAAAFTKRFAREAVRPLLEVTARPSR
jgi:hypothetical protein